MTHERWFNPATNTIEIIRNDFNPNQFKLVRYAKGLTKKEVAETLCVSPSLVTRLERGSSKPSDELMIRIVLHFGFPKAWYFNWDHPPLDEKKFHFCRMTIDDPPEFKKKKRKIRKSNQRFLFKA